MVWRFSKTAATNASADGTINFAEGQVPGSLNDSARALMARVAQYRDDISGALVTTGTGTAYAVSSNQIFDTLAHMDGAIMAFTPSVTNTGTITLNVDGLGTKPLRSAPGVELPAGTLIQGTPYIALYNATDSVFYLRGLFGNPYNIPLGSGVDYWLSTAPNSAFVFPYGQAISRTTYTTLFAAMGTTFGGGDGSSTFNIPDLRGRFPQVSDNMGGQSASRSVIGFNQAGGLQTATLSAANLPAHSHVGTTDGDSPDHGHNLNGGAPFTVGGTSASISISGGATTVPTSAVQISAATSGATVRHQHSFTTGNGPGSSTPFSILPPTLGCNYILRII
jgi:microcystin-dependent protein